MLPVAIQGDHPGTVLRERGRHARFDGRALARLPFPLG